VKDKESGDSVLEGSSRWVGLNWLDVIHLEAHFCQVRVVIGWYKLIRVTNSDVGL
jgi:hypothetical protein